MIANTGRRVSASEEAAVLHRNALVQRISRKNYSWTQYWNETENEEEINSEKEKSKVQNTTDDE